MPDGMDRATSHVVVLRTMPQQSPSANRGNGVGQDEIGVTTTAVLCAVGPLVCALPLACVIETMRPLPITVLAGAPEAVLGVTVIRGKPLPVLDLACLLNAGHEPPQRFVSVRVGEGRGVACAVGAIAGVRRIPDAELNRLPPLLASADSGMVAAIGARDRDLLLALDASRLVPVEVWELVP